MAQNQNQGYQPIDESKVNWDQIEEKFGISKEVLERTGAKDNMLNFGKSGLLDVTMLIYDQKVKAAARLQLTRLPDGTYSVLPHFVRKEQKLENADYMGYTFTKEDAKALKETGNLGKVVPLFNVKDNTMQDCFVSYDKQTNELVHYPVNKLHLRESVGNVKFTPEEMALLKQGGIVKDKQFEGENGQKFTVDFQVKLDNYPLKDGTTATMYLMFYPDKGQPFTSKNDPIQGKVVAPANESETQVAVNHQGKTNEATKKVDEPLQKGQVAPKNEHQKNEQKPEGEKQEQKEEKKKRGPKL